MNGAGQGGGEEPTITLKSKAISVPVSREPVPSSAASPPPQQPISGGLAPAGQASGQPVQPTAHPDDGFLVKHRWWVLGGSVALAIVLVVATWLLFADSSKKKAQEQLVLSAPHINAVSADVSSSYQARGFRRAAARAGRASRIVAQARAGAQQISDGELRGATVALLDSERDYLNAVQSLQRISAVGDGRFENASEDVHNAATQINSAVASLDSYELDPDPSPFPDQNELRQASRQLRGLTSR